MNRVYQAPSSSPVDTTDHHLLSEATEWLEGKKTCAFNYTEIRSSERVKGHDDHHHQQQQQQHLENRDEQLYRQQIVEVDVYFRSLKTICWQRWSRATKYIQKAKAFKKRRLRRALKKSLKKQSRRLMGKFLAQMLLLARSCAQCRVADYHRKEYLSATTLSLWYKATKSMRTSYKLHANRYMRLPYCAWRRAAAPKRHQRLLELKQRAKAARKKAIEASVEKMQYERLRSVGQSVLHRWVIAMRYQALNKLQSTKAVYFYATRKTKEGIRDWYIWAAARADLRVKGRKLVERRRKKLLRTTMHVWRHWLCLTLTGKMVIENNNTTTFLGGRGDRRRRAILTKWRAIVSRRIIDRKTKLYSVKQRKQRKVVRYYWCCWQRSLATAHEQRIKIGVMERKLWVYWDVVGLIVTTRSFRSWRLQLLLRKSQRQSQIAVLRTWNLLSKASQFYRRRIAPRNHRWLALISLRRWRKLLRYLHVAKEFQSQRLRWVVCCRWLQATRRKIRLRESLKTVLLHRLGKMWILWRRKRKMARQSTSSSSAAGLEDENRATVKLQRERSLRESGFRDDDGLWNTDTQISPTNAVSRPAVEEER